MIPALVLTAGLATRLRPLSLVRAKAALPVAGEPLARRILRSLAAAGVTEAVLNLHHLPHTLTREIGDGGDVGLRVRYSWEVPVLGSAGGPRRALPLLQVPGSRVQGPGSVQGSGFAVPASGFGVPGSRFLIVNGDTLTDLDLGALVAQHEATQPLVTMAVVANSEPEKYGGVLVDDGGVVTGFVRRGSAQRSYHFIGVQVTEAAAFASVPANVPYESVATLYPALMAERADAVRAFISSADFHDIGTPADYLATSLRLSPPGALPTGARVVVDATSSVERSILWDDVTVEPDVVLRGCIVTDGVRVPARSSWHDVALRLPSADVAAGERLINGVAVAPL
jgi:NDP-sugar pyrophosphorylase family protein